MCEHPLLIMSQVALQYSTSVAKVYFYDNLQDSSYISGNSNIRDFLLNYKLYDSETIHEVAQNSYFIYKGAKYPLFCLLPCGKCAYCRNNYKKEIENRAIIEAANSGSVIFYTLTYSDSHLPWIGLTPSHVSSAFKRLRIYINRFLDPELRFTNLYVGEYGTNPLKSMRPHYHGILFFNKVLDPRSLETLRQMFLPTESQFFQTLRCDLSLTEQIPIDSVSKSTIKPIVKSALTNLAAKKKEFIKRGYLKYNYKSKEYDFISPFYQSHPDLDGFWPHGLLFDFQLAKNPVALVRYVTKYITKNIALRDTFPIDKERTNAHWTPFFIQMPKKIGLGCKYLYKYKDIILNSNSSTFQVRYNLQDGSSKLCRVKIPAIFVRKLFPSVGQICPNCVFTAHLIKSISDELSMLTSKVIHPTSPDQCLIPYSPCYFSTEITRYLRFLRLVFSPYEYLTFMPIKRKDKLKIERITAWITGIYHNSDYQTVLTMSKQYPDWELDIFKIIDGLLDKLSPQVSEFHYKSLTFAKYNYYSQLQIPQRSYSETKKEIDLKILSDKHYVYDNMLYSPFNDFQ